ncbi:MAG: DUF2490 domain-containing protein [Desulfobacterales bacterium]
MNGFAKRFAIPVAVSACLILFFIRTGFADTEFVYRPEINLVGPLTERLFWIAAIDPRLSDDAQKADEIGLNAGIKWKHYRFAAFTADYKYISKGGTDKQNESRPRLAVELYAPLGNFGVALRNRFEYRMKEGEDDYWRYRVRVKLKFPAIGNTIPFIYEEVLYEFGDIDAIDRNEAGLGIATPLAENLGLTIDLRFRNNKSDGDWETAEKHLLTALTYAF